MALKRARALVDRFEEEPHVNPNTKTKTKCRSGRIIGWSEAVSEALPAVKSAQVRGSTSIDVDALDVPRAVKAQILAIESNIVVQRSTLVPWIHRATSLNGPPLSRQLEEISSAALASYEWPLRWRERPRIELRSEQPLASNDWMLLLNNRHFVI